MQPGYIKVSSTHYTEETCCHNTAGTNISDSSHLTSYNRRKLEEKAKLYEQMTKGDFPGWWSINDIILILSCTTKCIYSVITLQ